ncbi:hypothetical protein AB0D33_21020 [Streptomyces sp. NPDC048404]|uniref:hypothetical protein n=1 Tax=unclassified Streptomyces TaxID=2593676 RepID=UPI0034230FD2
MMSANRETDHDMATDADIAVLLARAADEVEIGAAPYQAVVRGGRRRRARRWATVAAAALVVAAGSAGTLALAGGTGGNDGGRRVVPAATGPSTPERRHVYEPQATTVARGTEPGREWSVEVIVWGAPRNETEARYQWARMSEDALKPTGTQVSSDLIGKGWVFVRLLVGDDSPETVLDGPVDKGDSLSGKDIEAALVPLRGGRTGTAGAPGLLVIGKVATTVREVTCTWDDGTTIKAGKAAPGTDLGSSYEDLIRPVDGSRPNWFVCVAPDAKHVGSGSAKVTK